MKHIPDYFLKTVSGLALFLCFCTTCVHASPKPESRLAFTAESGGYTALTRHQMLEQHMQSLISAEQELSPYDPELAEKYLHAGRLYQEAGEHERALEYLQRSQHNLRVNQGLYNPALFEPVELSILSHLQRLDYAQAIDQQQYLLFLHRKLYGRDSAATVPVLGRLGDLYFESFQRTLKQDQQWLAPQLTIGPETNYQFPEDMNQHEVAFQWLTRAQSVYHESISLLLDQQLYTDPSLIGLEHNLIRTMFLMARKKEIIAENEDFLRRSQRFVASAGSNNYELFENSLYRQGIKAFERIIAYQQLQPNLDAAETAETMLSLGDWHLLFSRYGQAREAYMQAWNYMQDTNCQGELISSLQHPAVPVQIPVFGGINDPVLDRIQAAGNGFIDVSFSISQNGRMLNFEVLDTSGDISENAQRQLREQLSQMPFRPYFSAEGEVLDKKQISMRYYVGQM